jgi:Cu+-exporting ATPase
METLEIKIQGMTCDACSRRIERSLNKIEGITAVVSYATESAHIKSDSVIDFTVISGIVEKIGYKALPNKQKEIEESSLPLWIGMICTFPLLLPMVFMLFGSHLHISPYIELILATVTLFFPGAKFFRSAILTILSKTSNMDVLVSLGSLSAYVLSCIHLFSGNYSELYFESVGTILTFVGFGKYLEKRAKRKTYHIFQSLLDSLPETVEVIRESNIIVLQISDVKMGDEIILKVGDKIPLDGVVREGISDVDESMFSGESTPVTKKVGDTLFAGTLVLDGYLKMEVKGDFTSTRVSQMFTLLSESLSSRPEIQKLVDKISAIFVPLVLFISFMTLISWYIYSKDINTALLSAISVLVISCPCALGLATPTAILTGNGIALKNGILFKNSEIMEKLSSLQTLYFDKTGTITEGKPVVVQTIQYSEKTPYYDSLLYSLVSSSSHPFSISLKESLEASQLDSIPINDLKTFPGKGITGIYNGNLYLFGSASLLLEYGISIPSSSTSGSISYFFTPDKLISEFQFQDKIRASSLNAIQSLKSMGIKVGILSGDRIEAVNVIGNTLTISNILGGLKPEEKVREIEKEKANGHLVGMVGDGINDSLALSKADVSFSLHSGTGISKEASDITLMQNDLISIPKSISLAIAIVRKIKQNLFFAFIYNAICIPLAALGYLNPMIAGASMALSSLSVISNSLLLYKWKYSN